jgi:hypothetical protein
MFLKQAFQTKAVKTLPVIDVHVLYESNICNSAHEALITGLPFKLPTLNEGYVRSFGDFFELGSGDAQVCIDWWLYHHVGGESETTVTSMDSGWLGFLEIGTGCQLLRDETHESSVGATRPDGTILKNGALVGKVETKYGAQHHHIALKELLDKNFIGVEKLFPIGSLQYVGIATTSALNSINFISFDRVTRTFKSELFQEYVVSSLPQRVKFLVDIAKLGRWIAGVRRPSTTFHLIPDRKIKTTNNHTIIWTKDGLLKQFQTETDLQRTGKGGCVSEEQLSRMHFIHSRNLAHVETGKPTRSSKRDVLITRIGVMLEKALKEGVIPRERAIADVEAGVSELHECGFAHGDLRLENVFVDTAGAFLDDLEYLTPLDDKARLVVPGYPNISARDLDFIQLEKLKDKINRL